MNNNAEISDKQYIEVLELREEEYRRSIRTLSSLLTSAMDTIEELQSRRKGKRVRESILPNASAAIDSGHSVVLNTADVAELLDISRATALKFVKAIGGVQIGSRWMISTAKLDEFIESGTHIDLN